MINCHRKILAVSHSCAKLLFLHTFALISFTFPTQRDTEHNPYDEFVWSHLSNTNHNNFKFDMIICYWKVNEHINDKKL